jgi:hypothetical protein
MTRSASSLPAGTPDKRRYALVGGVVALAVIAGLLLSLVIGRQPGVGAVDPTPSASPIPSAPAEPSEAPSEEPTPAPSQEPAEQPSQQPAPTEPPAEPADGPWAHYRDPVIDVPDGVLPPGVIVRVLTDGLHIRDHALLDSDIRAVVNQGDHLIIGPSFGFQAFGPEISDGFIWQPVRVLRGDLPVPGGQPIEHVATGWVAIGDGQSQWLEPIAPRCTDDEPTLQLLSSLTEWERFACFGDRQLTIEGTMGCGGCGGMYEGEFTPEWLAFPYNMDFISVDPQAYIGPFALRWAPDGPARPNTDTPVMPIVRVTGHYDDAAAAGCEIRFPHMNGETSSLDSAISQLFCRMQFVVDSVEIIGEDPNFPTS